MIRRLIKTACAVLYTAMVSVLCTSALVSAEEKVTVTIKRGALQEFGGFGMHPGSHVTGGCRDDIMRMIVLDLKLTFVRFYSEGATVQEIKNHINGRVMPQLRSFLEQNPDLFFAMSTPETVDSVHKIEPYCTKWAAVAKWVKEELGLNLKWATIVSEPNADQWWELKYPKGSEHDRRIPLALYPQVVKAQRAAYDAAGLQDIKLYGPEIGSVDSICHEYVRAIYSDEETLNSLAGWFTKTYNMGPDEGMKDIVMKHPRPYFGACGANLINWYCNEVTQDNDHYAAEMSGRIFSDFNHMMTHWAWFHPAQIWTDREAAHRLMWIRVIGNFNPPKTKISNDCSVPITLKYWYLKHIAQMFDVGGKFRYVLSDPPLPYYDMWWTFGQKPAVSASAIRNPDKSWTIGIINLAGCISDTLPIDDEKHPQTLWTFHPAAPYEVTVRVEELADHPELEFTVYRSNKTLRMEDEGTVKMINGETKVTLASRELVTLRGAKGAEITLGEMGPSRSRRPGGVHPYIRRDTELVIPLAARGTYDIAVLNAAGRQVIPLREVRAESGSRVTVSLAGSPAGVYLVKIASRGAVETSQVVAR